MSQTFVLDSTAPSYAAIIAQLQTLTQAKQAGIAIQSIRDAAHNANIKLVKSNITDAERVGVLAPLARLNYGVGIYKDEYPTQTELDLEGFNLLGDSERNSQSQPGGVTMHYEQPYTPDGSWVWADTVLPDSAGDGTTYGDRIVGYPTENGPFSTVPLPTQTTTAWLHGFHIAAWYGNFDGRTIAKFANMMMPNGASPSAKIPLRFDHWLKPGALSEGLVLQHEHSWIKDPGSDAWSIIEGSSSHSTANATVSQFYDPNFDTLEFTGELTPAADLATCKATPGTCFFDGTMDGGAGGWWAHMPDNSNPAGRVVGTGNFGFLLAFSSQTATEVVRENIAFYGLKYRFGAVAFVPVDNVGAINTIQNIDFHMLNIRYTSGSQSLRLFTFFGQNRAANTAIQDILVNVDQVSRGGNAFYLVNQDGESEFAHVQNITVQADPAARDGRENIFDIGGAVPWEVSSDGHAFGAQMANNVTCQFLKTRRCGGHIVMYYRNLLADSMTSVNRPVNNILIANNDCAEHPEFFVTGGSNAVGIAANSDNALAYPSLNVVIRDNFVRGYDTIPARAMTYCYRNILPDQVSFLGNDGDLAVVAQFDSGKAASHKWIDLIGSTGDWSIDDFIEDGAVPGTKLARIVKAENANPTIRLHYIDPVRQTDPPPDIASGVTINNMTQTGTGTTNGANTESTLGPNTLVGLGDSRNRFGNSGGTALWIRAITGAVLGGPDPTDRLSGGNYWNESDTDFHGAAGYLGINISDIGLVDFATYAAVVTTGNTYGVNSQVIP